jgi:hypothetical protein
VYPPASHLRTPTTFQQPIEAKPSRQENVQDEKQTVAPSYHTRSQYVNHNQDDSQKEETPSHYRSSHPKMFFDDEEDHFDDQKIWGDGGETGVNRRKEELPENIEKVLMTEENPYFLKQHWRQRLSNPSPSKGHRSPRTGREREMSKQEIEQMYKIKDSLQDDAYSAHSKQSKMTTQSTRSNHFKQNTPKSRAKLGDKTMWNGKCASFKEYADAIEGHLLQVGAGYLISKKFMEKYKQFADRKEDYLISGSFGEDYNDISSSQACLDRTYLYKY